MPHRTTNTSDEDAPMTSHSSPAALSAQQLLDWDEFEECFLQEYREKLKQEDAANELDYQTRKADLTVQLAQCQREKAASEKKLKASDSRIVMLQEGLRELDDEFQVHALNVRVSRNRANFDLKERFRKSRHSGPLDADIVRQFRLVGPSMMSLPTKDGQPNTNGREDAAAESSSSPNDVSMEMGDKEADGLTGVTIRRIDGTTIGDVERLTVEPRVSKNSAKMLLDLPIKRAVIIREGRKFGPAELESLYQSNDGRFSKWFSCMIQAVGVERPSPCDICSRNAGPFVSCVRVEGASPRCGNCEWSRRGCNDAEDASTEGQYASTTASDEPNDATASQRPSRQAQAAKIDGNSDATHAAKSDASGRRQPIAPAPSGTGSSDVQPAGPAESLDFDLEQLRSPDITLRHDGHVYTHPELMAGVPVEKIDQDHPYWEPNWKDPVDLIRTTLASHEEKYNQFVQDPKDKPNHNKYFHGRQINRGRESLEFLEGGAFHPFQIVGKRWVSPAITTYDTLHRLAGTLKELAKFKVTVSPADWLRQRLCEIVEAQGENFNLSSTVKDLYHDPKVQALRHLSGFGNVGRPVKGAGGGGSKRKRKRKEGSIGGSQLVKRTKEEPAATAEPEDDLEYDGYTDADSECDVTLGDNDFRLRALRNRRYTTAEAITQYWHLSPHAGFDLQLLQSVDPPEWTVASSVDGAAVEDFSVAMEDISEVRHHPESLHLGVRLRGGEGVMVLFWRERTKKRILGLLRKKGRVVRRVESWESLQWEWEKMGVNSRELRLVDFES